jgi:hypothetical protein
MSFLQSVFDSSNLPFITLNLFNELMSFHGMISIEERGRVIDHMARGIA